MPESILNLAIIGRLIGPLVTSNSRNLIVFKLSSVYSSISPIKLPLAVEQSVLEVALVGVSIAELACALAVVDLADLMKKWVERVSNQ